MYLILTGYKSIKKMANYTPVATSENVTGIGEETFANVRDKDDASLHHKEVDHVSSAHRHLVLQKSKQPLARLSSPDHSALKAPGSPLNRSAPNSATSSTKQSVSFEVGEETDKVGVRERFFYSRIVVFSLSLSLFVVVIFSNGISFAPTLKRTI